MTSTVRLSSRGAAGPASRSDFHPGPRSNSPRALQQFPELVEPDEQQAYLSAPVSGTRFGTDLPCWQIVFGNVTEGEDVRSQLRRGQDPGGHPVDRAVKRLLRRREQSELHSDFGGVLPVRQQMADLALGHGQFDLPSARLAHDFQQRFTAMHGATKQFLARSFRSDGSRDGRSNDELLLFSFQQFELPVDRVELSVDDLQLSLIARGLAADLRG